MRTNRMEAARVLAGLSVGQAAKLINERMRSFVFDHSWLQYVEEASPPCGLCGCSSDGPVLMDQRILDVMADIYGVSVAWMCGAPPEITPSDRALLDQVTDDADRAKLEFLLGAIRTGRP